ncbi:unnamed protein product [Urochloa humidicola]
MMARLQMEQWGLSPFLAVLVAGAHPGLALRGLGEDADHFSSCSRWIDFPMLLLRAQVSEVFVFLCTKNLTTTELNEFDQSLQQEKRSFVLIR